MRRSSSPRWSWPPSTRHCASGSRGSSIGGSSTTRLFGAYRAELQQLLSLVDSSKAAERLATEAVRELGATGGAVLDADGVAIATAEAWPVTAEVRLPIPGARGRLRTIVVGPRTDGQPHDPIAVANLEELATLAAAAAG